jgi:hypothetical protein|nr:MAG TPA: hypothetical protein [Crassvirales sp.]
MEKKFTVIDTRTMQKKEFNSQATTVAELKADLRKLGIATDGMVIQEGLTKTELKFDTALLPHDVPFKGGTTNNLVFRLTQAEKKIKSGAGMSRQEAYAKVKELGLTEAIVKKYNKNFTMCKTADLIAEIEAASKKATNVKENAPKKESKAMKPATKAPIASEDKATQAITLLTNTLVNNGILSPDEGTEVVEVLGTTLSVKESAYSAEDIDDMFKDM